MSIAIKVAVSQRIDYLPDRFERRDTLDQALIIWLRSAGLMPFPLPNALTNTLPNEPNAPPNEGIVQAWLEALTPSGIVLSGGNDLGQAVDRDLSEAVMLRYAKQHCLPVLGICRGMQMIAHQFGALIAPLPGHVRTRHRLSVPPNETNLWPVEVNSFHEQEVTTAPLEFTVVALSTEGSIEAIRHNTLPWEAWMWHPERENPFNDRDLLRLKTLFGTLECT
jgi:GMP synthase-like glutamine amidotransferase